MKRLFFVAVLLGTVILSGVFGFSYWRLRKKQPDAYFQAGKAYFEEGKFSAATLEFLNALKLDASNRDSRFYLALCYLSQHDIASGGQQLKTLLETYPHDVPANLKLGNLYLAGGPAGTKYYEQAEQLGEKVLNREPNNVSALVLVGTALAGLKNFEGSLKVLHEALALDPKNVSAWISLGSTKAIQKDFAEAERAFLQARDADPKDKNAVISLANFYRVAGSPEKAESIFRDALARYPADRELYTQLTEFYLSSRRLEDVDRILRTAQAASAGDPTPTLDLAAIYERENRVEDARALLLEAKSRFPKDLAVSIKLASNLMSDKREEAKHEIDQIRKADPKNSMGQALLAEYQYNAGQYDSAEASISKLTESSIPGVHYLLGNLALRKGKTTEAEEHFKTSFRLDRRFIPGRIAFLNGLVLQNRLAEARDEVEEILKLSAGNMPVRLIKASLEMAAQNYSAAEITLSALVKEFPDNSAIHRQLGFYHATLARNADAEKDFLRALELASGSEQSFEDLTQFYIGSNQAERALQRLTLVPDAQKQAFHYELMGRADEHVGRLERAERDYQSAIDHDSKKVSAEVRLLKLYLRTGRSEYALERLDALEKKSPSLSVIHALRGTVQHSRGDLKAAETSYRKALEIDPGADFVANNLAYLLSHEGRELDAALELAQSARRRQPDNPDIADTLGWIYYKLDNLSLAKSQAEYAVSKQPANGEYQYHLGEIYRKSAERDRAITALMKAVKSPADFSEKKLAAATLEEIRRK